MTLPTSYANVVYHTALLTYSTGRFVRYLLLVGHYCVWHIEFFQMLKYSALLYIYCSYIPYI